MGASGWEYLVPYQADLQAALNDLRRRVFESGDFTDEEYEDYFGSTRPARADWDRFGDDPLFHEYVAERWTGRAMVLWADDVPSEIAFWGYSGD